MQGKQVLLTGGTGGLGWGVMPLLLAQGVAGVTIFPLVLKIKRMGKTN